jgi:hypothetical protein
VVDTDAGKRVVDAVVVVLMGVVGDNAPIPVVEVVGETAESALAFSSAAVPCKCIAINNSATL